MIHELTQRIQPLLAGRTSRHDQPILTEGRKVVTANFELDGGDQVRFLHRMGLHFVNTADIKVMLDFPFLRLK
jgi:hypothetical protein